MTVAALSPAALAALVAEAAVVRSLEAAATSTVDRLSGDRGDRGVSGVSGVRVGVDGALAGDSGPVADLVAEAVAATGRPVGRVRLGDFLRPRSVRLELGPDDPDAGWERWYDEGALRREVLDALAPGGTMSWLPALWDVARDRSVRAHRLPAAPGQVVVVDGPHLLRPELADGFDLVLHLETSDAALTRRCPDGDRARVVGSWHRYLTLGRPARQATYVARFEDPRHPALVTG